MHALFKSCLEHQPFMHLHLRVEGSRSVMDDLSSTGSGTSGLAAGDASAPAAAVESHSAHEPTPQPPTASNVKHLQEAPATGQGATKTPQGVPSPAQEAPKPVKSAATQPSQACTSFYKSCTILPLATIEAA